MTTPTPTIPLERIPRRITEIEIHQLSQERFVLLAPSKTHPETPHHVTFQGQHAHCTCDSYFYAPRDAKTCRHIEDCNLWRASATGLHEIKREVEKLRAVEIKNEHPDDEVLEWLGGEEWACDQALADLPESDYAPADYWGDALDELMEEMRREAAAIRATLAERDRWFALSDDEKSEEMGCPFTGMPFLQPVAEYAAYFQGMTA